MRFEYDLTVPLGTLARAPAELEARLVKGTLRRMEIFFPPGPAARVYVTITDGLHQIAPANPGGSFNGDHETIGFDMNYTLEKHPYALMLSGWSPEAIFGHQIIFRFDVKPAAADDNQALLMFLRDMLIAPGEA